MSANPENKRFPRAAAIAVAREICAAMQPHCERLIVAGSLRRMKQDVGDVEIVYIPRMRRHQIDLLRWGVVSEAGERIDALVRAGILTQRHGHNGSTSWGNLNRLAVHVGSGIPVDFFATSEACWYNYLVCRTGPAALNTMITSRARIRGLKWNPYGAGFEVLANGTLLPMDSEESVFDVVGLEYLKPEERNAEAIRSAGEPTPTK